MSIVKNEFPIKYWIVLSCLTVLWSSPSFADLYLYKKNGSYYITDIHQGPNYIKHYKTKKFKRQTPVSSPKKKKEYLASDFSKEIYRASKKYGINPNLIKAVIETESNFRPDAVSPKGAIGLMQLMPKTATRFKVSDPFNPYQNIDGGTQYLKYLLSYFSGNTRLALAAYNAGEMNVKKHGSIPPFKETISYVRKVLNNFKSLEKKENLIYKRISPNGTILFTDAVQIRFTQ